MIIKRTVLFGVLLVLCVLAEAHAQSVVLNYKEQPLNEILLDLNDRYGAQVSINAELAAECVITIRQEFASMDAALEALAGQCALSLVKYGSVYVFQPQAAGSTPTTATATTAAPAKPTLYLYQGQVRESLSGEPLPFTHVQLGQQVITTDAQGRFSFQSNSPQASARFVHLGYQSADTLLHTGNALQLSLSPKTLELEGVVVAYRRDMAETHVGLQAGHLALNHLNRSVLPGATSNVLFNNLRLYPGITAAGESIKDFIIWGSQPGENHVLYDGITIFNSWGIIDDIGRVNPLMIKNMEVYKGGYPVPYGDRIGGLVLIEGTAGHRSTPQVEANASNQLINLRGSTPLFGQKATLQLAGRYSQQYAFDFALRQEEGRRYLLPKYTYGDFNVKLTAQAGQRGSLMFSSLASQDGYEVRLFENKKRSDEQAIAGQSAQVGSALHYAYNWQKGGLSTLSLAQSWYQPQAKSLLITRPQINEPPSTFTDPFAWQNRISETSAQLRHSFPSRGMHSLQLGGGVVANSAQLRFITQESPWLGGTTTNSRLTAYAQDQLQLSPRLAGSIGLKLDMPTQGGSPQLQPRVQASYTLSQQWKLTGAWGRYSQFLRKTELLDEYRNRIEVWQVANGREVPVMASTHSVLGLGQRSANWEFSVEAYHRLSNGYSRSLANREQGTTRESTGQLRAIGLDAYIKKPFGNHALWLAYSLGKVEQRFTNRNGIFGPYEPADQNQLHELKGALLMNLSPFHITLTSVLGSGFENTFAEGETSSPYPYTRVDLAAQYNLQWRRLNLSAGLSILNLLNRKNLRVDQTLNLPGQVAINSLGVPFTPTLYLNCRF